MIKQEYINYLYLYQILLSSILFRLFIKNDLITYLKGNLTEKSF